MKRPFTPEDIKKFPGIEVLSFTKQNGVVKEYLCFRRRDFISCFVVIDDALALFVRQFRPIIDQWTLEVPMGKIDEGESPRIALIRELREECRLNLEAQPFLTVRTAEGLEKNIAFTKAVIAEAGTSYPSPGFTDVRNFCFTAHLSTQNGDILQQLEGCSLLSEEIDLEPCALPLDAGLPEKVCGISRHYIYGHFFKKQGYAPLR